MRLVVSWLGMNHFSLRFRKEHPDKHQFEDDEERWVSIHWGRYINLNLKTDNYIRTHSSEDFLTLITYDFYNHAILNYCHLFQFEEQGARELKQIFEGQNYIGKTVNDLHRKLDEVIGRQERTLSQLSIMSQTGSVQAQGQPNQQVFSKA